MRGTEALGARPRAAALRTACALLLAAVCACSPRGSGRAAEEAKEGAGAQASGRAGEADRPNFLVIDVDSLRSDRVGAIRDGRPLTPGLDELARRGTLFPGMVSQASWTLPALAALLTGRHPPVTEFAGTHMPAFGPTVRTLPEIFGYYGYATTAFWGWTIAKSDETLHRGFDVNFGPEAVRGWAPYSAVAAWLEAKPEEPFFTLVHELDLHQPGTMFSDATLHRYAAPTPACGHHALDRLYGDVKAMAGEEAAREHVVAHYDAGLHAYDGQLIRIAAALDRAPLERPTVLVVTSNHGQDLFDHGLLGHGERHYDTVLRVPLVIVDPAAPARGRVDDTAVQAIDLAPTLLRRAGIPVDRGMEGTSILPLLGMEAGAYREREAFSLSYAGSASLRTRELKLICYGMCSERQSKSEGAGGRPAKLSGPFELYDLRADPKETRDVAAERAPVLRDMADRLRRRMREADAAPGSQWTAVPEELRRRMVEAGYWKNPAASPAPSGADR